MIIFKCSKCNHEYKVADEYAGKKARCKSCENVNTIPLTAVKSKGPQNPFIKNGDSVAAYNNLLQELLQQEKTAPAFDVEMK